MKEKPSQWEFIATVLVLLACAGWAFYEYRQESEKIPFEPVITAATWLIALLGYTKLGKKRSAEKPADLGISAQSIPEVKISNAKNTVSQSHISGTNVHIGDVIQYADHPIPRALTKAPFFPETFLGREADLRRIHERLFAPDGNFLLLVNGEGGIGKTTLASKYYHNYQHEYAHTAWLLSEKSIANALLQLADPLGLQFDERMGTEGRLDLLLTAMADLQKPCLLVLDNANELPDLDANYQHLRRLSNVHLLLTTRISNFEKAETLNIEGLPEAEALALFEGYYRPLGDEDRALFFQIREAVGGNTLVIELLAKNLTLFNKLKTNYTLGALLADLQEKGLLRLTRSQEVRTDYQSKGAQMRREKPEDIIAAMYDLGELPREEVALLSIFAVLPAESIGFETLETLLPGLENLETGLLALAQKGWIEYNEAGNAFKCSPVVQEIVRMKNAELRADCTVLVDALNEKLEYEFGTGHLINATYSEALHFARYAEAVFSNLPKPDWNIRVLIERIGSFHQTTGNLEQALYFYEASMLVDKSLCAPEPGNPTFENGLAISYSKLGEIHRALGNLEQALTFFEQYNQLTKELYEAFPQKIKLKEGIGLSSQFMGNTHKELGNLDQALIFYKQMSIVFEELYEAYPHNVEFKNGLAISYSKLGSTQSALGNLEQALSFFEKDSKLTKELYEAYPQNIDFKNGLAISYFNFGSTQSDLGNLEQALTFYKQYNHLEKELYEAYPQNVEFKNNLAISYYNFGQFNQDQNDKLKARQYFRQAEALWTELVQTSPQHAKFQRFLSMVKEELAGLE